MLYWKRSAQVEAFRLTERNFRDLTAWPQWLYDGLANRKVTYANPPAYLVLQTLEGEQKVNPGDWVVKGVFNEIYPVAHDLFESNYKAAV